MEKTINIPVKTTISFYRYYLEIINVFKHLRDREKDVMAYMMMYNAQMKRDRLSDEIRRKILFDYETKAGIKEALKIKEDNFNTILSSLRQKGVITKENDIHEAYHVNVEYPFTLSFKFDKVNEV